MSPPAATQPLRAPAMCGGSRVALNCCFACVCVCVCPQVVWPVPLHCPGVREAGQGVRSRCSVPQGGHRRDVAPCFQAQHQCECGASRAAWPALTSPSEAGTEHLRSRLCHCPSRALLGTRRRFPRSFASLGVSSSQASWLARTWRACVLRLSSWPQVPTASLTRTSRAPNAVEPSLPRPILRSPAVSAAELGCGAALCLDLWGVQPNRCASHWKCWANCLPVLGEHSGPACGRPRARRPTPTTVLTILLLAPSPSRKQLHASTRPQPTRAVTPERAQRPSTL